MREGPRPAVIVHDGEGRAAVGGSDFLRAVSNIDLMDVLKEARPDAYNDLIHNLQRKWASVY